MSNLEPTPYIESQHPEVLAFTAEALASVDRDQKQQAIALFLAVRDGIRYDPYVWDIEPEIYKASTTLATRRSFCMPKAILLAACARATGIPARLGFADVRNHLATERLLEVMETDLFVFHGYTELQLEGRWVKVTPSFNLSLCEKFGVKPLEFDGVNDAILHPFDQSGRRHMEYIRDHGSFDDFPLEEMIAASRKAYPTFFKRHDQVGGLAAATGDFEQEAALEHAG